MNKNYILGWLFALVTAFIWAVYSNVLKIGSLYFDNIHPTVFVLQSLIIASITLLAIAGPGRLSSNTLKNSSTWIYGTSQILNNVFIMSAFTFAMTATSVSLLSRMGVIIATILTVVTTKSKIRGKSSIFLIALGVIVVAYGAESSNKQIAIFLIFIGTVFQVIQSLISEKHKESNHASGDIKAELRVTGYVLSVTSVTYVLFLIVANFVGLGDILKGLLPTTDQLLSIESLALSIFTGIFVIATMKYFEFYATKTIGSTNFLVAVSISPVLTVLVEYFVDYFGIISAKGINIYDGLGCLIIVLGALLKVRSEINHKKMISKEVPKIKEDFNVIKDTIENTLSCFDNNLEQASQALKISIRDIEDLLSGAKKITKNIRNKIILNHAKNIVGLDSLTGLQNKTSFDIKLKNLENIKSATIVFIDLNDFKPVNDIYGHKIGDRVLKGVSDRLAEYIDDNNVIARLGGDEFGVILYGVHKQESVNIIKNIKNIISEEFLVKEINKTIKISSSIGVSYYPEESDCGISLKDLADKRMYDDKLVNKKAR